MGSFPESMNEYKKQLNRGYIQEAYQGLMVFFRDLRSHFKKNYPDDSISGNIYYDMTCFSLFPESLKRRKLKIAIVLFMTYLNSKFGYHDLIEMFKQSIGNC